jgi:hypothetical protein
MLEAPNDGFKYSRPSSGLKHSPKSLDFRDERCDYFIFYSDGSIKKSAKGRAADSSTAGNWAGGLPLKLRIVACRDMIDLNVVDSWQDEKGASRSRPEIEAALAFS